jgi:hypothetical protein
MFKFIIGSILLFSGTVSWAGCIDVSGTYLYKGETPDCKIESGIFYFGFPLPFETWDRSPVQNVIPAGTEFSLEQLGCSDIGVRYTDRRGRPQSFFLSLVPSEPGQRAQVDDDKIYIRDRSVVDDRSDQITTSKYNSYRFELDGSNQLIFKSRYQVIEQRWGWPFADENRMEFDCRFERR